MQRRKSKCPKTGKVQFKDEIAAKMALASAQRIDGSRRGKIETRAYPCPFCHKWHLTSQTRRRID